MEDQQTGLDLVGVIELYLLVKGTKTAVSFFHLDSPLQMAARFHDRLGWNYFVKGRIYALWVEMQAQEIHTQ
jgi:hypothetical protein